MSKSDGSTAEYYVLPEAATQLQDLISHRDMNSQIGEIFRACYRYGIVSHSDKMRDAKKIRFYAQAEVERLEKLVQAEQPSHIISDIPGEWIRWNGGACPVAFDTLIDVQDHDGEVHERILALNHWANEPYHWDYSARCSEACRIVAYRLSPARTAQ